MIKSLLIVSFGGALGSLVRYLVAIWLPRQEAMAFPWATFWVNIVGCFLIGLFYALADRHQWLSPDWRIFLVTGFCGGLTTFSAFAYENVKLLQQGHIQIFLVYSLSSFVLSLLAVVGGIYCPRLVATS